MINFEMISYFGFLRIYLSLNNDSNVKYFSNTKKAFLNIFFCITAEILNSTLAFHQR